MCLIKIISALLFLAIGKRSNRWSFITIRIGIQIDV